MHMIKCMQPFLFFTKEKSLIILTEMLANVASSAYEGSHEGLRDGVLHVVQAVLPEGRVAAICALVQSCATDDQPIGSHNPAWPLAAGDAHFPSPLWGDDGDTRGIRHDHWPTAARQGSHRLKDGNFIHGHGYP